MEAFYNEVTIMKRVSRRGHPHVITMVGYIPREYPPAIVMEFAPFSTLLKFLMKVKDDVRIAHISRVLLECSMNNLTSVVLPRSPEPSTATVNRLMPTAVSINVYCSQY